MNDISISDSPGALSVVEGMCPFFCMSILHTSCTPWLSASFLKHADYSGIGGMWYTIGVTGRLAPGLSCSGPRSFHKRRCWTEGFCCNSGLFIPATNLSRRATSKCSWKLHLDACCCTRTTNSRTVSLVFRTNV